MYQRKIGKKETNMTFFAILFSQGPTSAFAREAPFILSIHASRSKLIICYFDKRKEILIQAAL